MRTLRSFVLAVVALLVLAPAILADVCCGEHTRVVARPSTAVPGMAVTFDHLDCSGLYEPAPKIATLRTYLLTTSPVADVVNSLDTASWPSFKEIVRPDARSGSARIVVPDLPPG